MSESTSNSEMLYRTREAGCARTGQTKHRHSWHEKYGKRDSFTVKYGNAN